MVCIFKYKKLCLNICLILILLLNGCSSKQIDSSVSDNTSMNMDENFSNDDLESESRELSIFPYSPENISFIESDIYTQINNNWNYLPNKDRFTVWMKFPFIYKYNNKTEISNEMLNCCFYNGAYYYIASLETLYPNTSWPELESDSPNIIEKRNGKSKILVKNCGFNVTFGKHGIYYIPPKEKYMTDDGNVLYRMDYDGNIKKLYTADGEIQRCNEYNGELLLDVFYNEDNDTVAKRIVRVLSLDGKIKRSIFVDWLTYEPALIRNGYLYYVRSQSEDTAMFRVKIDTGEIECLPFLLSEKVAFTDKYMFFTDKNILYRVDSSFTNPEKIMDLYKKDIIEGPHTLGNEIYITTLNQIEQLDEGGKVIKSIPFAEFY